jgi:hypothetical protein
MNSHQLLEVPDEVPEASSVKVYLDKSCGFPHLLLLDHDDRACCTVHVTLELVADIVRLLKQERKLPSGKP